MPRLSSKLSKSIDRFSFKSLFIVLFFLLICITILWKFVSNPNQKIQAAWWNEAWSYRKAISITNSSGSNMVNYQVPITLDTATLVSAGKLQSNCNDLRITDLDGKVLEYWLSGCNTATTQIWPRVANIPVPGTSLYVYYGNPSAASAKTQIGTSEFPGLSCKSILEAGDSKGNGRYWIDPNNGDFNDKLEVYCDMANDAGGWILVTQSMINSEIGSSVTTTKTTNSNGGVDIANITSASGCGPTSNYKVFLNNIIPWTQVKADYVFTGGNSCWGIFGNTAYGADSNLIAYNSSLDTIRNQVKMSGSNGDNFDGITTRCDNYTYNFWHSNQGVGTTRSAQVILRRNNMGSLGGLGTGIGCITSGYGWKYQNIYIREAAMTFAATASPPTSEEFSPAPLAHWKFDEGNGTTVYDASSNKNDGVFGTGTSAPVWVDESQCISGKCLFFDGNKYIDMGSSSRYATNLANNAYTIEAWIKPNNVDANVITHHLGGIDYFSAGIGDNSGKLRTMVRDATNGVNYWPVSNTGITANKWSHVVFILESDVGYKFYINGKLDRDYSNPNLKISNQGTGYIGFGTSPTSFFKGFIDEVKIYPYARTAAQIKSDYSAGLAHNSNTKGSAANLGSNNNSSEAFSEGLVGYWKMDENAGTSIADSSGNNKIGNFGAGSSAPNWVSGKFGPAANFDGVDNYAYLNSESTISTQEATVSLWYKQNGSSGTTDSTIHQFISSTTYNPFKWFSSYNNRAAYWIHGGDNNGWQLGTTDLSDGKFHHLVLTFNLTNQRTYSLYIDGKLENQKTNGNGTMGTTYLQYFGQYGNNSRFANGIIDEVRIYNRTLSSSEVQQLYNWTPGPHAYYNFDEKSGNTLNDISNNGLHGDLTGHAPTWSSGKYGGALKFNGTTTNYVSLPTATINGFADYSICYWVKSINITKAINTVFHGTTSGGNDLSFEFEDDRIDILTTSTSYTWTPASHVNDVWYHNCIVRDIGTTSISIYENGVKKYSTAGYTTPISASGAVILGQEQDGVGGGFDATQALEGYLDELKIYNYVRTQKQIIEDMNASHPIGGSPVGSQLVYYKFDEGYGTTTANWGNGGINLNGILGSGNSSPSWTNDGKFNKALSFNGTGNYLTTPSLSGISETTWTVWVKPNNTNSMHVIKSNAASDYMIANISGKAFRIRTFSGSGDIYTNSGLLPTDRWSHLAMVYTNPGIKIYLNGKLENQNSTYTMGSLNSTYSLGKYGGAEPDFNGLMDEFKIYNSALTEEEIKIDYNRNSSLQMGSLGSGSGNTAPATAASQEYCIPGDTSSCLPPSAEWKLDEKSGSTINDFSGNNASITLGAGNSAPDWTTGKFGSGLSFVAPNYGQVNDTVKIDISNSFTIGGWVNMSQYPVNWEGTLFAKMLFSSPNVYGIGFGIRGESDATNKRKLIFYAQTNPIGSSLTHVFGNTVLNLNTWYYIAANYNKSTGDVKLYVNGMLDKTQNISTSLTDNSLPSYIGHLRPGYGNFIGKIDQIRFYNYDRTPAQIAWDYNRGGPAGWWKFDECQGSTANDWSFNGNNGTINIGAGGSQNSLGTCSIGTSAAWTNGSSGKYNSSISFDGADDYVNLGNPTAFNFGTRNFSYCYWLKTTATSGHLFGKATWACDDWGSWLVNTGKARFEIKVENPPCTGYSLDSGVINDGQWHHLCGTYDRSGYFKVYTDGKVSGSANISSISSYDISNGSNLLINGGAPGYSNSKIDDVRLYNYNLTSEQVKTVYNNGAVYFGP